MKYTCPQNSKSRKTKTFRFRMAFVGLVAVSVLTLAATTAFMSPGAIYTTDSTCSGVNINIFGDKDDVYLNGGPAGGGPGLPPGSYYVRVTQPGGGVLGFTTTASVTVNSAGNFAQCYQLSAILVKQSDATAGYDTTGNPGFEYKVEVSMDSGFAPGTVKSDNFKVRESECQDCGPVDTSTIRVRKYYDANANGLNDDAQPITGWKVNIHDGIDFDRFTPANLIVDPDNYVVSEYPTIESNWLHTGCAVIDNTINPAASSACVPGLDSTTVNLVAPNSDKTVEFGNVCLGAGGGHTLGFWSNKNGQATMKDGGSDASELTLLSTGSNLVGATGLPFNPGNYNDFRNWLLSANATNMAYMLSAQLAAMKLNVEANFVNGGGMVYAPCLIGSAANETSLGFISINDLISAADTELGLHPNTVAAGPNRSYQECLKNALDSANNNLNFVQATPCKFSFADQQVQGQ